MFKLYGDRRPENINPLDAVPSFRLNAHLSSRLPGWAPLFKSKWSALSLLTSSGNVADAAFLNVVHMYKRMLGQSFPTGVFEWPATHWVQERTKRLLSTNGAHSKEPPAKRQATEFVATTHAEAAGCQPKPAGQVLRSSASSSSKLRPSKSSALDDKLALHSKWAKEASMKW